MGTVFPMKPPASGKYCTK